MVSKSWDMHFPEFPGYLSVKVHLTPDNGVSDEGGTVRVEVHSTIHVNKAVSMPNSWSLGFVERYPERFRGDVMGFIIRRYGLTLDPPRYS